MNFDLHDNEAAAAYLAAIAGLHFEAFGVRLPSEAL
jgi:hypothetical protein